MRRAAATRHPAQAVPRVCATRCATSGATRVRTSTARAERTRQNDQTRLTIALQRRAMLACDSVIADYSESAEQTLYSMHKPT